jgi:hypothetical protein
MKQLLWWWRAFFGPVVVRVHGKYAVRRWVLGFEYLSHSGMWFGDAYNVRMYCLFDALDEAKEHLVYAGTLKGVAIGPDE